MQTGEQLTMLNVLTYNIRLKLIAFYGSFTLTNTDSEKVQWICSVGSQSIKDGRH